MSDDRAKKSRLIITTKPEMTPQPGAILNLLRAVSVWHFGCDWLGRGRCYQTVGRESPTRASRHRPCWRASAESTDHAAGVDFTDDGQRQNSVPTLERLSQCASSAAVERLVRKRLARWLRSERGNPDFYDGGCHRSTQAMQRLVCLGPGTAGVRYQFFKTWHCSVARAARTRLTTLKAAAKTFVKIWRRPMKKSG